MTVKQQLHQAIDGLNESRATVALALFESARSGTPLVDMYGTPWGAVLTAADADAPDAAGPPTITIPDDLPQIQ
jgi:hypothetical protein